MISSLRRRSSLKPNPRPALLSFTQQNEYSDVYYVNSHDPLPYQTTRQVLQPVMLQPSYDTRSELDQNFESKPLRDDFDGHGSKIYREYCHSSQEFGKEQLFRDIYSSSKHSKGKADSVSFNMHRNSKVNYNRHQAHRASIDSSQSCINNYLLGQYDVSQENYNLRKSESNRRLARRLSRQESYFKNLDLQNGKRAHTGQQGNTGTISRFVGGVVKKRKHIVILGLDGSGKTTLLMQMKYKSNIDTTPTVGFNHEKVLYSNSWTSFSFRRAANRPSLFYLSYFCLNIDIYLELYILLCYSGFYILLCYSGKWLFT